MLLGVASSPAGPQPERAEVEAHHSPAIANRRRWLRAAYRALMLDLMERIWGIGPDLTASLDAVREERV